jgi:uncharacterized membrane protein YhaH (DUF805 family)
VSYYLDVWRGYFDFSGRARRKEFWFFTIFHDVMIVAGVLITGALSNENPALGTAFGCIVYLYVFASFIPFLAVTVRRLHDIDYSGWWLFVGLIPVVGEAWLFVLMCLNGTKGANQYGPDPRELAVMAPSTF